MFEIFIRLAISLIQLGLVHFIFSNISFADSEKSNEKIALKNYLHGFLIYIIGFGVLMSIAKEFFGFPKALRMPLFFGGLVVFTLVWLYENREIILENMKHTMLGDFLGKQAIIVRETMVSDPMLSEKYPFHFYEPNSELGSITEEEYLLQKDTGAKLVIERK